MSIYALLFLILIVLWFANYEPQNRKGYVDILATAAVFAVIGLRDLSVGADTETYKNLYIANYDWGENEVAYTWLSTRFNRAEIDFHIFLIVIAVFCGVCFFWFVRKYSEDYLFTTILFVGLGNFTMYMTGLRQTIAISLAILAIMALIKKKWYFFFPLVYLASMFHYSALILLPLYLLSFVKLSRRGVIWVALLVGGFLTVFGGPIFEFMSQFLPDQYADSIIDNAGRYSVNLLVVAIDLAIFAFCCFGMPSGKTFDNQRIWTILMFLQLIAVALQLTARTSMQIQRVAYYLDIAKLVLIPNALTGFKKRDKIILQLAIIGLTIAKFFISVPGGYSKIDQYTFFFS